MSITARLVIAFILILITNLGVQFGQRQIDNQLAKNFSNYQFQHMVEHDLKHTATLIEQWLMTVDLFINDRSLYLAAIIHKQSATLEETMVELKMEAPEQSRFISQHIATTKRLINNITRQDGAIPADLMNQYMTERKLISNQLNEITAQIEQQVQQAKAATLATKKTREQQTWIITATEVVLLLLILHWLYRGIARPTASLIEHARKPYQEQSLHPLKNLTGCSDIKALQQSISHLVERLTEARMRIVTEKHEAHKSEQTLDALVNTSSDAVLIAKKSGTIHNMNKFAYELFALVIHPDEQYSIFDLIPEIQPDNLDQLSNAQNQAFVGRRSDGKRINLLITASKYDDDSPKYVIIAHKDSN